MSWKGFMRTLFQTEVRRPKQLLLCVCVCVCEISLEGLDLLLAGSCLCASYLCSSLCLQAAGHLPVMWQYSQGICDPESVEEQSTYCPHFHILGSEHMLHEQLARSQNDDECSRITHVPTQHPLNCPEKKFRIKAEPSKQESRAQLYAEHFGK